MEANCEVDTAQECKTCATRRVKGFDTLRQSKRGIARALTLAWSREMNYSMMSSQCEFLGEIMGFNVGPVL